MLGTSINNLDGKIGEVIRALQPKSILEYGCGQGKLAKLCKVKRLDAVQKLFAPDDLGKLLALGYKAIVDADIKDYLAKGIPRQYDMIAALDVLEHFYLGEALGIIDYSLYNCDYFLAVWPSRLPQNIGHEATHNAYDLHRSSFELRDLARFDVVYYTQASLEPPSLYHLAVLRGHMNQSNGRPI